MDRAQPERDDPLASSAQGLDASSADASGANPLGADALAICTEWKQFLHPDFEEMRRLMRRPVVFDGRNIYNPQRMREAGFTYYSIGRPAVQGEG